MSETMNPDVTNNSEARRSVRDVQRARRMGVNPSNELRRHFIALARRVKRWSQGADLAFADSRPICIGVTGLGRRVGKSTVSFNLASALTSISGDRVLLIESDFGKNYISRRLGQAGKPGLSDILLQQTNAVECVMSTPLGELDVIGCGRSTEQQAAELPFEVLDSLVPEELGEYSFLLFDLPVANDLTSCYSIIPHLDGVILTVDSRQINQQQVNRFSRRTGALGVDILGVVINKA